MISIDTNTGAVVATLTAVSERIDKSMVRALNRGILAAKTLLSRNIAADAGLAVGTVKDALPMREASLGRPEARLAASLKRIPLMDFRARGPVPSKGEGRGVTYALGARGRGRAESAFIATMRSGHEGVFKRFGPSTGKSAGAWSKNLPIAELHGPSIGHVFAQHRPAGAARAAEVFGQTFDREMQFRGARDAGTE